MTKNTSPVGSKKKRKPPVRIPLPFDVAVEGLLAEEARKKRARKTKPGKSPG